MYLLITVYIYQTKFMKKQTQDELSRLNIIVKLTSTKRKHERVNNWPHFIMNYLIKPMMN